MTPIPTELRELMEHIVSIGPTDYETMYRAKAQLKSLLATPPADAADMGGQAGEEVPQLLQDLIGALDNVPLSETEAKRHGGLGPVYWNNAVIACKEEIRRHFQAHCGSVMAGTMHDEVLAVVTLGGLFHGGSGPELGDIDIEPDMRALERVQCELVNSSDDVHIELIDRRILAQHSYELEKWKALAQDTARIAEIAESGHKRREEQHRQQAGKLVEALRDIRKGCVLSDWARSRADKVLADWEKTKCNR